MTAAAFLLFAWALLAAFMAASWALQEKLKDVSVMDVAWGLGIGAAAVAAGALMPGEPARRLLVAAMGGLWGLRLGGFLWMDRVGKPEDGRYAAMRAEWGADAPRNFLIFSQAQAASAALLSFSFVAAASRPGPLGGLDALGAAIWLVAVAGESAADAQLARFRAEPANAGKACRSGLWAWSRHPNYFFESVHWLAYAALAPADWRAWVAPPVMLYFLLKATGVTVLEAHAVKSRGEDYRRYQRETPAFFPRPPKRP